MDEQELRDRIDQLDVMAADYESRWHDAERRANEAERERDDVRYRAEDRERELQRTIDHLHGDISTLEYRLRDAERHDSRYAS